MPLCAVTSINRVLYRCDTWSFALALLLQHVPVVVSFRIKHPQLWDELYQSFSSMPEFESYVEMMKELENSDVQTGS